MHDFFLLRYRDQSVLLLFVHERFGYIQAQFNGLLHRSVFHDYAMSQLGRALVFFTLSVREGLAPALQIVTYLIAVYFSKNKKVKLAVSSVGNVHPTQTCKKESKYFEKY
jgi:hypothetical protein